jgi:hypothetical protein
MEIIMTIIEILMDIRRCHAIAHEKSAIADDVTIVELVATLSEMLERHPSGDLESLDLPALLDVYSRLSNDVVVDSLRCIFRERVLPCLIRRGHFIGFSTSYLKAGTEEFLKFKLNDIGKDVVSLVDPSSTHRPTTGVVIDEVIP